MDCCCKKGFPAALAVFAFKIVSGMVLCGGIFKWVYALPPVNVWRPIQAPGISFYVGTFIVSMLFVFFYKTFSPALAHLEKVQRGLMYGLGVWAVGILPGMLATHVFMPVNHTVVIYWTISGLILTLAEGLIVALILGDGESCSIKK
ncbi:MAG: hypothetical protein HQL19_03950 [Candidatus Omnitrophica bacterium]|nr:hypothetical protein [Candidatus Omnitrophota bacterium]